MAKTGGKSGDQVLALTPKRVEQLLADWANYGASDYFFRLYKDILPNELNYFVAVVETVPFLRRAWDSASLWHSDYYSWLAEMVFQQWSKYSAETIGVLVEMNPRQILLVKTKPEKSDHLGFFNQHLQFFRHRKRLMGKKQVATSV